MRGLGKNRNPLIPIYQAVSYEGKLKGGTTSPWIVVILNGHQPLPYVVKLYTVPQHSYSPKLYEVACSVLAPLFGLDVPDFSFVEFDDDFISDLEADLKLQLKRKDWRINFATKLIDGSFKFEEILERDAIGNFKADTIFAFDYMVCNLDRTNSKPNILFKGTKSYLIDHEKTFCYDETTFPRIINGELYDYKKHIFYNYLKKSYNPSKLDFFDEFYAYLSSVNFNILDGYIDEMERLNLPVEHYIIIKDYLCSIQKNKDKFINLLKRVVS